MCTNTRYIRNQYTGKIVLVNCGHCKSCRQQKAARLTRRIRFQHVEDSKHGKIQLFLTLTYAKDWIPYVMASDIVIHENSRHDFAEIPIYRDSSIKRGFGSSFPVRGQVLLERKQVQVYGFNLDYEQVNKIHLNQKNGNGKISIIYYKDLQDFQKRLKINCDRYLGIKGESLRFFNTSEYGETTFRSHFHVLVTIPADKLEGFRRMVRKSWIYGYFPSSHSRDSVARDCSRYVASYVNQPSDLPAWLQALFPAKHSFTHYYGFDSQYFSFEKVREMVQRGDLHLPIFFDKSREQYSLSLLLPSVLSRYFPLFKGLSRLYSSEISELLRCPSNIGLYSQRCEYNLDDCRMIDSTIRRCRARCGMASLSKGVQYAALWQKAWSVYKQNVLSDWYRQQQEQHLSNEPPTEYYDNLTSIDSHSFRELYGLSVYDERLNPNKQHWRTELTDYYTEKYDKLRKEKKVNYHLYGES